MRARLLLAVLLAIVGLIAILQYDGSESRPSAQPQSTISQTRLPDELAAFPPEALETIALIQDDGPFPHRQDGAVFMNRERRLPIHERGYWREYTVPTPGSPIVEHAGSCTARETSTTTPMTTTRRSNDFACLSR